MENLTTASQVGSQDTTMVGALGSYADLGSVSEGISLSPGAQARRSVLLELPSVREGQQLTSRSIQVLK